MAVKTSRSQIKKGPKKVIKKSAGSTQGKRGNLEVSVLHGRCIGAAVCVFEAAGSFKLNKQNKALVTDLSKSSEKAIINAARNCPTQAIFIYKNKKQTWPKPGPDAAKMQPGDDLKMNFD